jgi:hypothetical protein
MRVRSMGMQAMTSIWQPYRAMNGQEFETMASVLEARHGSHAAEVAEFFASFHTDNGDESRAGSWAGVAECVRERQRERLQQD